MTAALLPPKVAEFVQDYWKSASHRRMFFLGQLTVKVAGMFQLSANDDTPSDAAAVFILLLEGMESGDASEYARCDALAMDIYRTWLANREVH